MSLTCCGVCGEEIGLSNRCVHQPAPAAAAPPTEPIATGWIEDLLADCTDDEFGGDLVLEEMSDDDFNVGIPRWAVVENIPGGRPHTSL